MPYNSINVLYRRLLDSNIIERVDLMGAEVQSHICRHLRIIGKKFNPVLHAQVIIKRVAVKVVEFRNIPF